MIDEIGPMELRGKGFSKVLKEILMHRKEKLLLVVREGLAKKVKDYFAIDNDVIINEVTAL